MAIATRFWTYAELEEKVQQDLDLEGELFIQPEEMMGYFNEAIDKAEQLVHGLYEDYFLTRATITLVSGTHEYSLPSGIYAHKLRRVIYRNGARCYTVHRIRDWKKFEEYSLDLVGGSQGAAAEYRYLVLNETAAAPKILFTPEVGESGAYITAWYLRQANRLSADADTLDIPEAANYVMQYVKTRAYEKEGHPNLAKAMGDLQTEKTDLEGVLAAMVPDADNEIEADLSFYSEMN